jgi:hypothetical protein
MAYTELAIKYASGARWDLVAEDATVAQMLTDFETAVGPVTKETYVNVSVGGLRPTAIPIGTFVVDWANVTAVLTKVWSDFP